MTTLDSPVVARVRENVRYLSDSHAEDVEAVLAELDEARRELAALPEWRCPSCGATTRARMADRTPRVWLEGDTVPEETWFLTDEGSVEQDCTERVVDPDWSGPLVEVFVPDEAGYDAAVAAERTRRETGEGT